MNAPAEQFMDAYTSVYNGAGFPTDPAGPIYVQDGSTVFASCTVSNYREALRNEAAEPGSVMLQRSFRTRTLDQLHLDAHPNRRALFDMYGGFESATESDASEKILLHGGLMQTTLEECGVDTPDIAVMADRTDWTRWDVNTSAARFNAHAYPDTPTDNPLPKRAGKIVKEYGEGILGHGVEVFVRSQSGEWGLAGNVVETICPDDMTSGIDYGGGLEATVMAVHGPEAAYLDAEMCERFQLSSKTNNPRLLNLLEALEALMIMHTHEHERHPLSVTNSAAAYAARAILLQTHHLGVSDEELRTLGGYHTDHVLVSPNAAAAALEEVALRKNAIQNFMVRTAKSVVAKKISLRRQQASRQGHSFDKSHEAKLIIEQSHKLPADVWQV
ncbi:MAG: hypothetical protein JWP13_165, partial [Candidatus Saccharibacteria bacterium]|nr:hypothetical protein [Candidatus Saccharibacteria bacterium]